MAPQTTQLLLPEDLADAEKTRGLPEADRDALLATSKWLDDYVTKPHKDLGRQGSVCPFVPGSLQRGALSLAPEHIDGLDVPGVVQLMDDYRRFFLSTSPTEHDDEIYKTIIVVFTDLPAERAAGLFNQVLEQLAGPAYEEDGVIYGPFYEGNAGTAIYNSNFLPFQSPVPFLFVRHTVPSDWKFFIDDPDWFDRWARHFGASGANVLAQELRRLPWRGTPRQGAD